MNKMQKRTANVIILTGVSLASTVGQAAINVSAQINILGSIKNFFVKSKSKKVKDSLKQQKIKAIEAGAITASVIRYYESGKAISTYDQHEKAKILFLRILLGCVMVP